MQNVDLVLKKMKLRIPGQPDDEVLITTQDKNTARQMKTA